MPDPRAHPSTPPDPDPSAAAAGAASPNGGDAIFQAEEPGERTPRRTALLWQYFFFPLLIVAAAVGVFLLFGLVGGGTAGPSELLARVRSGGENEQQQASHQLALLITQERARVEDGKDPDTPPFYADPDFRRGLRDALSTALEEGSEERQAWLLVALGLVQDQDALPLFERVLYPGEGASAPGVQARLRAMQGLFQMELPSVLPLVERTAHDDDAEVRALSMLVLARLLDPDRPHEGVLRGDPRVETLLLDALDDPDGGVQVNAAAALGMAGNPAAAPLLARSLDRDELAKLGIRGNEVQRGALVNAIRAARHVGGEDLRARVERLTRSENEGEDLVRQQARRALERWSTS